jgi:hypothetical protein
MNAPILFADLFARNIRHTAEARKAIFVGIYSFGVTAGWDFPRDSVEAHARLRAAKLIGQQVVVFKRQPDGVWRTWATANLPESRRAYS